MVSHLLRLQNFWQNMVGRQNWGTQSGTQALLQVSLQMNVIVEMCWHERLSHRTSWPINRRKIIMTGRNTGKEIIMRQSYPERFIRRRTTCTPRGAMQRRIDLFRFWVSWMMESCEDMCLSIRTGLAFQQRNIGRHLRVWCRSRRPIPQRLWIVWICPAMK